MLDETSQVSHLFQKWHLSAPGPIDGSVTVNFGKICKLQHQSEKK